METTPVFLDMDGVIADFESGVQEWYGAVNTSPEVWEYNYRKDFGMSSTDFWEGLTLDFWEGLPKTPEADVLMAMVAPLSPVILSSPPMANGDGVIGKIKWLKKNYPQLSKEKRWLFGSFKQAVARPGAILIDDKNENIAEWNGAGGTGILWPAPWNLNRQIYYEGGNLLYVQDQLLRVLGPDY